MSIPQSDVQLQAEPGFALELILRIVVVKSIMVFRIEAPCVTGVLEEHGQLELPFHPWWAVDEVDQIEPLVDTAASEQRTVKRIFVDDYQPGLDL